MRRRLQDFLGGNAKCVVMANISGAMSHAAHTAHTLAFARRAKNIVNVVCFHYLVPVFQQCTHARWYMFACAPDQCRMMRHRAACMKQVTDDHLLRQCMLFCSHMMPLSTSSLEKNYLL